MNKGAKQARKNSNKSFVVGGLLEKKIHPVRC